MQVRELLESVKMRELFGLLGYVFIMHQKCKPLCGSCSSPCGRHVHFVGWGPSAHISDRANLKAKNGPQNCNVFELFEYL